MSKPYRKPESIRCAVYTRKSTEEGLDMEFNSLDAQREAAEAYITSQKHEGWLCLPEHYDDGGFTGGNMERPALKRLIADVEAGKIDCVIVYKVDRLSRSLLDFTRILESIEKQGVSFVSVTQQFNTTTSIGRLTLNILLSFAQFEREIISERTRDKIAATRRKGKWTGGRPILGYDAVDRRLVVNEDESRMVSTIFGLYLEHQSLIDTIKELDSRGWTNKQWVTKKGQESGGKPFNKSNLFNLLRNPLYIGKVTYKDEIHEGEHPAIVGTDVFQRVQRLLKRNGRTGGSHVRNRYGALLKGLLRCTRCDCAMGHTHTSRNGNKRYRYYVCMNAQKRGWDNCSSPSVPAQEMEQFVIDQIKAIGNDKVLLTEIIEESHSQREESIGELEIEKRTLERELKQLFRDVHDSSAAGTGAAIDRLADLQERIRIAQRRATEVNEQIIGLSNELLDAEEVEQACAVFDPVWETLAPKEQARIIHLLVIRVDYDGQASTISITFHPAGMKALSGELQEAES